MSEIATQGTFGTWNVPECPFTLAYAPEAMDSMRLAVTDALFSLPRGGAEIGGVLLGRHTSDRVTIEDHTPLDCEHVTGPSFVLSARDETILRELLEAASNRPDGLVPVGWYHSHTRTEIFLSDIDLELHRRFFPEPWQVALVFKPHTFQPMRCGFFFREANGSIRSSASYREFTIDPLALRAAPGGPPATTPADENVTALPAPEVPTAEPAAADEPAPVILDVPRFAAVTTRERSRLALKVAAALLVGLSLGAIGYQARHRWTRTLHQPAPAPAPPVSVGLTTFDNGGQLQIRWDRFSAPVQQATSGALLLTEEGKAAKRIPLDPDHLRSGTFTYARESERVDVALLLDQRQAPPVRAVAAFAGKLPARPDPSGRLRESLAAQEEQIRRTESQLAEEASQNDRLKRDLAAEVERNRRLEKNLNDATDRLHTLEEEQRQQQRKRMGTQDPGKL